MKNSEGLACFGLLGLLVFVTVGGALLGGWVFSILWGWFVSPFFGIQEISIPYAVGLSLVAGMLTNKGSSSSDKDTKDLVSNAISNVVFVPMFTLLIGWVVKMFI